METIIGLLDESGVAIVNLNTSWTSKPYELGINKAICIQFGWDNIAVQGVIYLDYSAERVDNLDGAGVSVWTNKTSETLDGTFQETMFLDSQMPIASYRLRFVYTSGTANMTCFTVRKV